MDARCTGDTCSVLQHQTFDESIKCTLAQTVKDEVDGCECSHNYLSLTVSCVLL